MMGFAVVPAMSQADWKKALLLGALFVLRYGTYDLTNPATIETIRAMALDLTNNDYITGTMSAFTLRTPGPDGTTLPAVPEGMQTPDEVRDALASGHPVVALESTIISHGMPYPQNVEMARTVEGIVREG